MAKKRSKAMHAPDGRKLIYDGRKDELVLNDSK